MESAQNYCREFILTKGHVNGDENCEICSKKVEISENNQKDQKQIPEVVKEKKKMNPKSNAYKKIINKFPADYQVGGGKEFIPNNQFEPIQDPPDFDYNQENYDQYYNDQNNQDYYEEEEYDNYLNYENLMNEADLELENLMQNMANVEKIEKFKDCECCHGEVYNCNGEICQKMEACYCFMHEKIEEGIEKLK